MSDLPVGWGKSPLSQLCSRIVDGSHNPPPAVEFVKPMLSARNIQRRAILFDNYRFISDVDFELEQRRTQIETNDVLLTIVGTIGRVAVVKPETPEFSLQRSAAVLRPNPTIAPQYLGYVLESPRIQRHFIDTAKGTAQKGVYLKALGKLEVELAPLAEQVRIVNQLNTLLARVQACNDRFDAIPALLKRFRRTVLDAAFSGQLSTEMMGTSPKESYPRIRLSEIAESRLGKMLDRQKNTGTPTPYIGNVNVRWFSFDLVNLQQIFIEEREKPGLEIRDGDVFICEGGEPGRCAIWDAGTTDIVFQKALHRVRPFKDRLLPQWLAYCIRHMTDTEQLKPLYTGTTIRHLTGASLAQVLIPLPDSNEQTEIIHRVEALFAMADRIEARCTAARTQAQRLTSLVLAKAFRGELVPQVPNDEPADALLARIALSNTAVAGEKKRKVPVASKELAQEAINL
jgi:type I restriction enzyme S subunit